MTWKYFGQFRIIYSKIMKSTRTLLAGLAWFCFFLTVAQVQANCVYKPRCGHDLDLNGPSAIASGAEIVTYGEPCFCKESIPYSVQIPKEVSTPVECLKSYGYSVITPSHSHGRSLQLPVKIQTPIVEKESCDHLSGRSYGVTVQHETYNSPPKHYSFDCAFQTPVHVKKVAPGPSMSISFEGPAQYVHQRFGPLSVGIQTPVQKTSHIPRLTGLTAKVDRVLVPACEINGCPDCNDIIRERSHRPHPTRC